MVSEKKKAQIRQAAKAWERSKFEEGSIAQIRLKTDTETIENFKNLLAIFGRNRPIAMRNLCGWYEANQDNAKAYLSSIHKEKK